MAYALNYDPLDISDDLRGHEKFQKTSSSDPIGQETPSPIVTEKYSLRPIQRKVNARKSPIQNRKEPLLVSVSSLLRWNESIFSRLELAILEEGIVDRIQGLQVAGGVENDELVGCGNDSDNLWIQNRVVANSIEEDRRRRARAIEKTLDIIRGVLRSDEGFISHANGHSNSSGQIRAETCSSPLLHPASSGLSSPRKRKSGPGREDSGDEDSESEKNHPRRPQKQPRHDAPPSRRFACPYFKRSPQKYMHQRACSGPGWTSVRRVKLPQFRCNRCAWEFQNPRELALHQRSARPCELRLLEAPLEGVSPEQEKQLKSRKKDFTNKPEDSKWTDMYFILFPNDDPSDIPTPYYEYLESNNKLGARKSHPHDSSEGKLDISAYEAYLELELPPALQRELERDVELELRISDHAVKDRAVGLIRSLQPKILKSFLRSQRGPLPSSEATSSRVASRPSPSRPGRDSKESHYYQNTALQEQEPANTGSWATWIDFLNESFEDSCWSPLDENSLFDSRTKKKASELGKAANFGESETIRPREPDPYSEDSFLTNSSSADLQNLAAGGSPAVANSTESRLFWESDFAVANDGANIELGSPPNLDVTIFSDTVDCAPP
ncbi:hypothetical protein AAE478_001169 [Parahypoxylon ruwenzoriense]